MRLRTACSLSFFALSLAVSACGDSSGGTTDDAGTDLGAQDTGTPDTGTDLGTPDLGTPDLGTDLGTADAGCASALACDDGNACTTDSCDGATGDCVHAAIDPDDANVCTTDACDPTTGVSHTAVSTDDANACTADACDPTTGVSHTAVSVDDANACTADACDPTTGVSHTPVSVDDADVCTADACDPTTGVSHTAIAIDDSDACTADACDPVTGVSHTPVSVDDANVCTTDACDPVTGVSHTAVPVDDSNVCTDDLCDPVTGISHPATSVDDSDACTADACDPVTGISHTPIDPDDANVCTTDACDPATGVSHTPVSTDDSDACTADACDPVTGVSHTPIDPDDGNACTTDSCDPATGVSNVMVSVDDGVSCTVDTCDTATGAIAHAPTAALCELDGFACTVPSCDAVLGCSEAATDTVCDDGVACTTPDTCVGPGGDALGCSRPQVDALCPLLQECNPVGCQPVVQRGLVLVTELRILGTEMVELYNNSASDLDLADYTLSNAAGDVATLDVGNRADLVLAPGAHLQLVANPADLSGVPAGVAVYGDPSTTFAFADGGDVILVRAPDGTTDDVVDFRTVQTTAAAAVAAGQFPFLATESTQLSFPSYGLSSASPLANDLASAWCGTFRSATGDSAGAANHGCQIALLNELLIDPTGSDEGSAFIELVGPAGATVGGMVIEDVEGGVIGTGTRNAPQLAIPVGLRIPLDGLFLIADLNASNVTIVTGGDLNAIDADLENGGGDGVQLVLGTTLLDAFGTTPINGTVAGFNNLPYFEGTAFPYPVTAHSASRVVPLADADDNATDFYDESAPTPGAANVP